MKDLSIKREKFRPVGMLIWIDNLNCFNSVGPVGMLKTPSSKTH